MNCHSYHLSCLKKKSNKFSLLTCPRFALNQTSFLFYFNLLCVLIWFQNVSSQLCFRCPPPPPPPSRLKFKTLGSSRTMFPSKVLNRSGWRWGFTYQTVYKFSTVLKHLYHQISSIWIEKKHAFCPRCFLKAIKYAENIYKSYKLKHAKISTLVRTPQKDLLLNWFPKVIRCRRTVEWSRAAWFVWVRANSAWSCQLTVTHTTIRPESPEMPNEVSSATKKGCTEG